MKRSAAGYTELKDNAMSSLSVEQAVNDGNHFDGTDDWTVPESVKKHPYFVEVVTSLADALKQLDEKMTLNNDYHLITRRGTMPVMGKTIFAGDVGVWNRNGRPVIALSAGNYWNLSLRHHWAGKYNLTQPIDILGLTCAQAGQSEALVVQDPQNRVFIVRNGGFAAYGSEGRFRVLALVDTLNLGNECAVIEPGTRRILGWKREITTTIDCSSMGNQRATTVTVATFFSVPAMNVCILQRGNKMMMLSAGQHVITNPSTIFRGFFSLGERQTQFKTQPAYTLEGVPVILNVNLRYRIFDPLMLSSNYDDAFQALANPAQSAVNSVVSRLSYQQFMRAGKINTQASDDPNHIPWLEAFRNDCLMDLSKQARGYGIVVESFDVLDRELQGALGRDLEVQSERVLRNQVEATQIELQNHIQTETQRGKLAIARVQADQQKTLADANYYTTTKESDAALYAALNEAKGKAQASSLQVEQEVKNVVALAEAKMREIGMIGNAYAGVPDGHGQRMQLAVYEVEKRKALPASTVYFSGDQGEGGQMTKQQIVSGIALSKGFKLGDPQ